MIFFSIFCRYPFDIPLISYKLWYLRYGFPERCYPLWQGFRHESLLRSFGENRMWHSQCLGVQPNNEATDNRFILFECSTDTNRNNLKILKHTKKSNRYWISSSKPFGRQCTFYSHSRSFHSNYEATGNVFNHFWSPSINFNHKNLKINQNNFGLKIEKKQEVSLTFFSDFLFIFFGWIFNLLRLKLVEEY